MNDSTIFAINSVSSVIDFATREVQFIYDGRVLALGDVLKSYDGDIAITDEQLERDRIAIKGL
jgi:hypothetical protein